MTQTQTSEPVAAAVERPYLDGTALLRPGVLDREAQRYFSRGHCHSFAVALHRLSGYLLVAVTCRRLSIDGVLHVEVASPGYVGNAGRLIAGTVLDVHGESGIDDGDERWLVSEHELARLLFEPDDGEPWPFPLEPEFALPFAETLLRAA